MHTHTHPTNTYAHMATDGHTRMYTSTHKPGGQRWNILLITETERSRPEDRDHTFDHMTLWYTCTAPHRKDFTHGCTYSSLCACFISHSLYWSVLNMPVWILLMWRRISSISNHLILGFHTKQRQILTCGCIMWVYGCEPPQCHRINQIRSTMSK